MIQKAFLKEKILDSIIIAFRSRTDTLDFVSKLRSLGGMVTTITTPKEANVGCGLSAKTSENNVYLVRRVLNSFRFRSFAGVFKMTEKYGRKIIKPY